jgi:hypothetical protein
MYVDKILTGTSSSWGKRDKSPGQKKFLETSESVRVRPHGGPRDCPSGVHLYRGCVLQNAKCNLVLTSGSRLRNAEIWHAGATYGSCLTHFTKNSLFLKFSFHSPKFESVSFPYHHIVHFFRVIKFISGYSVRSLRCYES